MHIFDYQRNYKKALGKTKPPKPMYTPADKLIQNKTQLAANAVTQKKHSNKGYGLIDNRPEAIAQRKMQELTNNQVVQRVIDYEGKQYKTVQEAMKNQTLSDIYFNSSNRKDFSEKLNNQQKVYRLDQDGKLTETEEAVRPAEAPIRQGSDSPEPATVSPEEQLRRKDEILRNLRNATLVFRGNRWNKHLIGYQESDESSRLRENEIKGIIDDALNKYTTHLSVNKGRNEVTIIYGRLNNYPLTICLEYIETSNGTFAIVFHVGPGSH